MTPQDWITLGASVGGFILGAVVGPKIAARLTKAPHTKADFDKAAADAKKGNAP